MPIRGLLLPLIMLGALGPLAQARGAPEASGSGLPRKVLVERGRSASGRLLARYEAFDLYEISPSAAEQLGSGRLAGIEVREDFDRLELKAAPFNTRLHAEAPQIPTPLREPAALRGERLFLVQFVGPLRDEWLRELRKAGATPVYPVPVNGYLVWGDPGSVSAARPKALGAALQYVGTYHPYYKLAPALRERVARTEGNDELVVTVQRYAAAGPSAARQAVSRLASKLLLPWQPILGFESCRIQIRPDRLTELLAQPDLVWIEPWVEPHLLDEVQNQILANVLRDDQKGPRAPGYLAWLRDRGLSLNPEDYPIVTIVDDGIGNGSTETGDPTLHAYGSASEPTRVVFNEDCTSHHNAHGLDGHGHINASIAGGYDERAGAPFLDGGGYSRGLGVNPFGRIGGIRIFGDYGYYEPSACNYSNAFIIEKSYAAGSRISSNSWGASVYGDYDYYAQAYDAGTRDAQPGVAGNQQMLFVFAAGNDGSYTGSIVTPATAKNVLSVGASENDRPDASDGCYVAASDADDAQEIVYFSSRGPAEGKRVKPDVVAPGTHVQGTASTAEGYTGYGVCDAYWPSEQTVFARSSGTSHSTPAVAGVASLYHHWIASRYLGAEPSPALLKAYVLAHTSYLSGAGARGNLPSNSQGYGMPDLSAGLDEADKILVEQRRILRKSGATISVRAAIADPTRPFRAVLVWTDAPGPLYAAPQVNDLDLIVKTGTAKYLGNRFAGAWSKTGGRPDSKNTAEAVFLPPGTEGAVQVQVLAKNIAGDGVPGNRDATDQDFALVLYNAATQPGFRIGLDRAAERLCQSGSPQVAVRVRQVLGFATPVALRAEGLPEGAEALFDPAVVSPGGSASLTIEVSEATAPGRYPLQIVGSAAGVEQKAAFLLDVEGPMPAPQPLLPADRAEDVPLRTELSWEPIPGARTYRVQLASDPGFTQIVAEAELAANRLNTPKLAPATELFWRVSAKNGCGEGPASPVQSFKTLELSLLQASCSGLPLDIPDLSYTPVSCKMEVPAGFHAEEVTLDVDLTHPYLGDLTLWLQGPNGGYVTLVRSSENPKQDLKGNFDRDFTPVGPGSMADFEDKTAGGTWTFFAADFFFKDVGKINAVRLNVLGYQQATSP
jgi:subtilisin-like proprotein convertase family protein